MPLSIKHDTVNPRMKGVQVFSNEGPALFSRKDKLQESENTLTKFKNLLLQNQGANFNQT